MCGKCPGVYCSGTIGPSASVSLQWQDQDQAWTTSVGGGSAVKAHCTDT